MRLASSCAIIQYRVSSSEEDVPRMMIAPRGFRKERVPAGWQIVPVAHRWYYGLRILDEEMQLEGREERACMSL